MRYYFLIGLLVTFVGLNSAQETDVNEFEEQYLNWFNKDITLDKAMGVSVTKTYEELLRGQKPKDTIIVAVIDGGVDIHHEDLQGKIWINTDEIPDNNIDDDQNGYVDDYYGWNYIGNEKGEHIDFENFEMTRLLRERDASDEYYQQALTLYQTELNKILKQSEQIAKFEESYNSALEKIFEETGITVTSEEDLTEIKSSDDEVLKAKAFLTRLYSLEFTAEELEEVKEYYRSYSDYYLNKEFNPRGLVGDNPSDFMDRDYGNNDIVGPRATHGTGVAGVIAASRNNDKGIDGIAENVKIMPLRVVPDGDERDKDIALAIMYAVDNGARVINMSFGKQISPYKEFVDSAVRYAEKHDVLLVHASGNDGTDVDEIEYFPSDRYIDRTEASNWITVGATNLSVDKELPAVFSNYGANHVDIFAPGANIVTLDTSNTYSLVNGTSFAAPVVSGVSALLLSYYPELTPQEVIEILMESSAKVENPRRVYRPDPESTRKRKTRFHKLSKSGGIVNAYRAFQALGEQHAELHVSTAAEDQEQTKF